MLRTGKRARWNADGRLELLRHDESPAAPVDMGLPASEHTAPSSVLEELVANVWCEVLSQPRVGVDDNFFVLGGHSLNATQVVARLQEALGIEIPVMTVFEAPTVAELSARVFELVSQLPADELMAILG